MASTFVRVLITIVGCCALASCSAGPGTDRDADGGAGSDPQISQLKFAKCMREHGIDVPDPKTDPANEGGQIIMGPGNGDGIDPETFQAAHEECIKYLDGLAGAGGPATLTEDDKERMLEVAKCFREHGVEMPDPNFDGGAQIEIPLGDPDDPAFEEAREACGDLFSPAGGQ